MLMVDNLTSYVILPFFFNFYLTNFKTEQNTTNIIVRITKMKWTKLREKVSPYRPFYI